MERERKKNGRFTTPNNYFVPASHFLVHLIAVSFTRTTTLNLLISRLKEDINKRRSFLFSFFKFGIGKQESECRIISFSVALERTYFCAFRQH